MDILNSIYRFLAIIIKKKTVLLNSNGFILIINLTLPNN